MKNMRDFNTVYRELQIKLQGTGEVNGKIYWYNGVPELLIEMMSFLMNDLKNVEPKEGEEICTKMQRNL